jgi:hypothetical protein|tara:strand:- start:1132 stop:2592 length:1461 start_codon:yes stop_codon:yes gene_type:complete
MSSKIKVDNIADQGNNNMLVKCGSTLTIGATGNTVTLASGASQSGFGRSGSVDWQTTPKTANFTAANGEGYFINSGSALTMNLPAGSAGAIVAISDYARNFATHNFTISPNGSEKIGGEASSASLNVNGQAATFVYVDSTKGWVNVQNAEDTETGTSPYPVASGGTESTCGDWKIHKFTSPGTFTVSGAGLSGSCAWNKLDYFVVAGGGGGSVACGGGGGGAGGFRESRPSSPVPETWTASPLVNTSGTLCASVGSFPVTVGSGGAGGAGGSFYPTFPDASKGSKGSDSIFSSITSTGGGEGAAAQGPSFDETGFPGGSGGGGGHGNGAGGTGNTPSVSPPQGTNGNTSRPGPSGQNPSAPGDASGGGGGAGGGGVTSGAPTMLGGAGVTSNFSGAPVAYAGGGGGTNRDGGSGPCTAGGTGGGGPGGHGPRPSPITQAGGVDATANTGGGGGGATATNTAGSCRPFGDGGNGGSGIVIIRYKYQN